MGDSLRRFFSIPPRIRPEFLKNTLQKNRLSLLVICIMVVCMELFNMARVLFWSNSGLRTANNRFYFTLYCLLLADAFLYLLLRQLLRKRSAGAQWILQYSTALFMLLWHVCVNAYDLMRDPQAQTGIYTTAVLGLAVFIQMPGLCSLVTYGLAYGLFMGLVGPILEAGDLVNLSFTTIVALAVSLTSCRHAVCMISQQMELERTNQKLHAQSRTDPLTGLLNTAAFRERAEAHLAAAEAATALMILDMDDFKSVNDGFGHPCGDYLLKVAALRFQAQFPEAVAVARIGGDEFMAALSGVPAEEIRQSVRQLIQDVSLIRWRGLDVGACCSVGVCIAGSPASYDAMYEAADAALYRAKAAGKGRCALRDLRSGRPTAALGETAWEDLTTEGTG